ncbi:MAG: hypothetical protein AB7V58_03075 [Solirubrobacterales bacterium]
MEQEIRLRIDGEERSVRLDRRATLLDATGIRVRELPLTSDKLLG